MARTMQEIAQLLQQVKFKRRALGGVDEQDVWRTLDGLQKEYRALVEADRGCYAGLLRERENQIQQLTQQLTRQAAQLKAAAELLRKAGLAGAPQADGQPNAPRAAPAAQAEAGKAGDGNGG